MSRRFGRNQRRQMREEIATSREMLSEALNRSGERGREIVALRKQHEVELREARRARDSIRVTVDAMMDERENAMQVRAKFDMMSARREPLYAALEFDGRDIITRSDTERAAFVKYAGEVIAEHALSQIIRHWRSK